MISCLEVSYHKLQTSFSQRLETVSFHNHLLSAQADLKRFLVIRRIRSVVTRHIRCSRWTLDLDLDHRRPGLTVLSIRDPNLLKVGEKTR